MGDKTTSGARDWLAAAGLGVLVFALAAASLSFTAGAGRVAAIWPANAVVVAVLLRARRDNLWRFGLLAMAGCIGANLFVGDRPSVAAAIASVNAFETLLCVWLTLGFVGVRPDLTRTRDLLRFAVIGGVVAPLSAAVLGGAVMSLTLGRPFPAVILAWYAADALGLLIVTPAVMAISAGGMQRAARQFASGPAWAPVAALVIALLAAQIPSPYPLRILLMPALLFCAARLGASAAALAILATTVMAILAILTGHGGFIDAGDTSQRLRTLQMFLALQSLVVLPIAAVLTDRARLEESLTAALAESRRSHAALQDAERLSRLAGGLAGLGYWRRDFVSGLTVWSDRMYEILGVEGAGEEPIMPKAPALEMFSPEDRPRVTQVIEAVRQTGEPFALVARVNRASDGAERTLMFEGEGERDAAGAVVAMIGVLRDVTDEVDARNRLEESETRYRRMTETSHDIILQCDLEGTIEFISAAARRFGYEPGEVVGANGFDLMHPDDLPALRAMLMNLAARSDAAQAFEVAQFRVRAADGSYCWVESIPVVMRDEAGAPTGFTNTLRDISARKAAEEALAESEARYRTIAHKVSDIISMAGPDGAFTYVSPSVEAATGYTAEELTGRKWLDFVHPDDLEASLAHYVSLYRGQTDGAGSFRYRARHKDGRWIWLEANPSVVREQGGRVVQYLDVTRYVGAQVEIEDQLNQAKEAAEAAAAAKSDFLANMSHEIRTPLTAILGFTNLMAERPTLPEDCRADVERINGAGKALLSIVNDVLDFSKLEVGEVAIKPRPTAVREVLAEATELLRPQAEAKGLELRLEVTGGVPAFVSLDSDRVRQVVLNLLGNAVKFTERGFIVVSAAYDEDLERLSVQVTDTGGGLDEGQQAKLFQRFSQVDASTARRHGGTGLGLAICRGLVEAMGGAIGVISAPGEGSKFYFHLAAPIAEPEDEPEACDGVAMLDGVRVLVTDDNPINRELARALLQAMNAEVYDACDGESAIERAQEMVFDLLLMDIRMPGLDGPTAAARIRAAPGPNQRTPILAFTADIDRDLMERHRGVFDGLVRKPLNPAGLARAIIDCLVAAAEAESFEDLESEAV
jgi:PAS domain S-box-containing protein